MRQGRATHSGFHFLPDEGGGPVDIETSIILPGWAVPEVFNGRTFRVVYLQSSKRALKNEAIDIEILAGRDAGFHDSVDARPFGACGIKKTDRACSHCKASMMVIRVCLRDGMKPSLIRFPIAICIWKSPISTGCVKGVP